MWTLVHAKGRVCCGIFPTEDAANNWGMTLLPELELQPIELLVDSSMEEFLLDAGVETPISEALTIRH